jgi:hypothetical protein
MVFEIITDDYNKLMSAYKGSLGECKTKNEERLIHMTFGAFLEMIKSHPSIDKEEMYKELNEIYCKYYTSYVYNIKMCSKKNFNHFREIVCDLLDKYGPPYSDSRTYYVPVIYESRPRSY